MKGLILKDWYILRKAVLLYMACCIAFQAAPGGGVFLTVLYASMLPSNTFAFDDRSKWGELAAMMPCSVREIVLSRYIVGWAGILLFNLSGAAGQFLFSAVMPGYRERMYEAGMSGFLGVSGFVTGLSLSALFMALILPLNFRFDAEKSRILRVFLIALVAGTVGVGFAIAGNPSYSMEAQRAGTGAVLSPLPAFLCASLATAVSMPLSMLAYRARRK